MNSKLEIIFCSFALYYFCQTIAYRPSGPGINLYLSLKHFKILTDVTKIVH